MTVAYEAVSQIWVQVLGVEEVSAGDDFFALGGDSMAALTIAVLVRDRLGLEADDDVPLFALFEEPTFGGYARAVMDSAQLADSA